MLRGPWLSWAAPVVLAALVGWAGWTVNGWRQDAALLQTERDDHQRYVDQVAARDAAARASLELEQQKAASLARDLSALRDDYTDLAIAAARAPNITRTEVPPNANGSCTVVTRSTAHRVCIDAAWSRDPALIAECKAYRGDGVSRRAVPARPELRRDEP